MLAHGRHAAVGETVAQRARERSHGIRGIVEGALADDLAAAVVEVEHRREAEVDAGCAELDGDHAAPPARIGERSRAIGVVALAEHAHGGNRGEAVAEALHATALVVDRDEQRRIALHPDVGDECCHLRRRRVVASEQDDAADHGARKARAVRGGERETLHAEHHRPRRRHDAAASRSSAFICRTASRKPTKTERETIAWPMCSSRTPGSAATGCTLK